MNDVEREQTVGEQISTGAYRKLERALTRAQERLVDYELLVDKTQHMLNTRISELEAARAAVRESEARFRQLAEAAYEAIIIDQRGTIVDCNHAACDLYGRPRETLIGDSLMNLVATGSREVLARQLVSLPDERIEQVHRSEAGIQVPVEVRIRSIVYGGEDAIVLAVRDITEHKAMEAQLRQLASTDPLTGVANRRHFLDTARREFFRAFRYRHPVSVMMLDVDHFKQVNDRYGHEAGDTVLRNLTDACVALLRTSDLFGRLGGEEFAVLLPATDLEGAVVLAERLRVQVADLEIATELGRLSITVSIGVAQLQPGDHEIDQIVNRADKALYAAKHQGRNRVVHQPV